MLAINVKYTDFVFQDRKRLKIVKRQTNTRFQRKQENPIL